MNSIGRWISLAGRRRDAEKDRLRVLERFARWKADLVSLAPAAPIGNNLLLIRLDDIGDYVLFRNQLAMYKKSARWGGHRITLLGNASWRELFLLLDAENVDEVIWTEKNRYLEDSAYRESIWRDLRSRGFDSAVAVSCTRPLLLDDLCILAAAPLQRIGNANTNVHDDWNRLSDDLYTELFQPPSPLMHEFHFNAAFAEWACGLHYQGTRPEIDFSPARVLRPKYILCFVGASIRSKRWPASRWVELIRRYREIGEYDVVIAGNGPAEIEIARIIEQAVSVESVVGEATLTQILSWVANAAAVISNDTMAAHIGASFDVPTIIIANGVNYARFADYSGAGIPNVRTLYPRAVIEKRKRYGDTSYAYSETVTADIVSISATQVLAELCSMLNSLAPDVRSAG